MASNTKSVPSGYVIPCPANPALHTRQPLALVILRGPKAFFAKCGGCGTRVYLPFQWTGKMGMDPKDAARQGLLLLTDLSKPATSKA